MYFKHSGALFQTKPYLDPQSIKLIKMVHSVFPLASKLASEAPLWNPKTLESMLGKSLL